MATKIILTVKDGLSRQEMDDIKYLFADALSEFAVKRAYPAQYVEQRYNDPTYFPNREEKTAQVTRRVALAGKLHDPGLSAEFEHIMPHKPTPVLEYYKTCDEDDLPAMTALLEFLPASQFGERKGWMVARDTRSIVGHGLLVTGPDEQHAVWYSNSGHWEWVETPSHKRLRNVT